MGTIVGSVESGVGVAPGAQWIACKRSKKPFIKFYNYNNPVSEFRYFW